MFQKFNFPILMMNSYIFYLFIHFFYTMYMFLPFSWQMNFKFILFMNVFSHLSRNNLFSLKHP